MSDLLPPDGLGEAGLRLWSELTEGMDYRPDEAVVLREACHTADVLASERATPEPNVREIRMQSEHLRKLLAFLNFEDDPDGKRMTEWGRALARRKHHGAS